MLTSLGDRGLLLPAYMEESPGPLMWLGLFTGRYGLPGGAKDVSRLPTSSSPMVEVSRPSGENLLLKTGLSPTTCGPFGGLTLAGPRLKGMPIICRGLPRHIMISPIMMATIIGTARMIAESKRVVPSSLPDGKRHMLIGFVKIMMRIKVVVDRRACA